MPECSANSASSSTLGTSRTRGTYGMPLAAARLVAVSAAALVGFELLGCLLLHPGPAASEPSATAKAVTILRLANAAALACASIATMAGRPAQRW